MKSSREAIFFRRHEGKVAYATLKEAKLAAAWAQRCGTEKMAPGYSMQAYGCHCGKFHFGHGPIERENVS